MSGGVGLSDWFMPVYIGLVVVVFGSAVALLVGATRRPAEVFPGGWPAKRLRWAAAPAVTLALIALQVVLAAIARASRLPASLTAQHAPAPEAIGLATVVFSLLTLCEGIVYMLRVKYPSARRSAAMAGEPEQVVDVAESVSAAGPEGPEDDGDRGPDDHR